MNGQTPDASGHGVSRRLAEIVTALGVLALGGLVMWDSQRVGAGWASDGPQAGYFPFYIGLILVGASAFNLLKALIARHGLGEFATRAQLHQVLAVFAPTALYVAAIPWLGIYLPSALFIAYFMRRLDSFPWSRIAPVAVGVPAVSFVLFELWFLVPLPKGPIEAWLGY